MKELTGDEKATTIVSSVLNQLFGALLIKSWKDEDGHSMFAQIAQGRLGEMHFRNADNTVEMIVPPGMGGARMAASRDARGDIAVSID